MNLKKGLAVLLSFGIGLSSSTFVYAEDYSNEAEWYEKCSQVQTTQEGVDACEAFQKYTQANKEQLTKNIENYRLEIENLEAETAEFDKLGLEQKNLVENLNAQIELKQQNIDQIEANLAAVQEKIDEKQAEIDVWDEQIKKRMQNEQANVGVSMAIDLIMGSLSLDDMIRRITGIERITQADQSQVDEIEKLKKQLDFQKAEYVRLDDQAKAEKADLDAQKEEAEALEASYQNLIVAYQKRVADLTQAKRDAQTDLESIREFTITSNIIPTFDNTSGDLIFPVDKSKGYKSAGTWSYPGADGSMHLGLDWATPIGTQLYAPANGLILYANNPVPGNSGYLGSWDGHPAGGGNTISMLANIQGTLYALTFLHLNNEGMLVKAGDVVSQGQPIAQTGNSGNSTGPHCHIEFINLGNMSVEEAVSRFQQNADFSFGTGWNSTATACENGQAAPCRERPEKFYGE